MSFLGGEHTLVFDRVIGTKKRGTWQVMTGKKIRMIHDRRTAKFEDQGCEGNSEQAAIALNAASLLDQADALTGEVRSLGKDTPARSRTEVQQVKAFELAASCILKIKDRMLRDEFLKPALAFIWPPRITLATPESFEAQNLIRMRKQLLAYAATMSSLEEHHLVGRLRKARTAVSVALLGLGALYIVRRVA